MSVSRLGAGGSSAGSALTGAHRQGSYKPPSVNADLPLQIVGITRGVVEPAGGALQIPLPAGILAGDVIIVRITGGGLSAVAYTTPNGFSASVQNAGLNGSGTTGATNAATDLYAAWVSKVAVGGDTGPTFTWAATGRGGTWSAVVFRPSAGATATIHGSNVNGSLATTSRFQDSGPAGTTGRIQHYIYYNTYMGSGNNTADPNVNTMGVGTSESADSAIPSAISAGASAVGVREFLTGGWGNSQAAPGGQMGWAANAAVTTHIIAIEETGGSAEPVNIYVTPTPGKAAKGAWSQMLASASFNAKAIRVVADLKEATWITDDSWFLDIGVGLAGSEQVVAADISIVPILLFASTVYADSIFDAIIPVSIPAGSRVAARTLHRSKSNTVVYPSLFFTLLD